LPAFFASLEGVNHPYPASSATLEGAVCSCLFLFFAKNGVEQLFQGGFFYDARVTHISLLTAILVK
jgi:hypothetical protein